jgi:hypothetical protein
VNCAVGDFIWAAEVGSKSGEYAANSKMVNVVVSLSLKDLTLCP